MSLRGARSPALAHPGSLGSPSGGLALLRALRDGVIVALITEPLPGPVVGILGITAAAALGLVTPAPDDAIRWTLSGFSHSTVWLIFVAFCLIWKFSRILG